MITRDLVSRKGRVALVTGGSRGIGTMYKETCSYATSKAGLIQLTRLLTARPVNDRVHVTATAGPTTD